MEEVTFTMNWYELMGRWVAGRVYLRYQPGQRAGSESELQGNLRSQVLAKVREETRWVSQAGSAGHEGLHLVLFEARSRTGVLVPPTLQPLQL